MDTPLPALSPEEYNEGAIECSPSHKWDLEAAALDRDGILNVWNEAGQTVEIAPRNKDAIVALLLQGRLHGYHMNALIEATGDVPVTPEVKTSLKDLFDKIQRYAPPAMTPVLRTDTPVAALLWTVTPELRITSCTGNAKQYMRESDRELLKNAPDLWTLLGTTDPTHPILAAHLQALAGKPCKFTHLRGVEWTLYLQPVNDEMGVPAGVVGYATVTAKPVASAPKAADVAYVVTSEDGTLVSHTGDLFRILGVKTKGSPESIVGQEIIQVVHEHFLPVVENPKPFIKRLAAVLSSETEETDRIVLTDGRVLHRHMQPLKDSVGAVLARAWVITEVVVKRATRTIAAAILLATMGIGAVNSFSYDDGGVRRNAPRRLVGV